jgi:hypothetical protein
LNETSDDSGTPDGEPAEIEAAAPAAQPVLDTSTDGEAPLIGPAPAPLLVVTSGTETDGRTTQESTATTVAGEDPTRTTETVPPAIDGATTVASAHRTVSPPSSITPSTTPSATTAGQAPAATTQGTTTGGTTTVDPSTEYVTDDWDGVANIEVAIHDGRWLELVTVEPVDGMTYRVEEERPTSVKIEFRPSGGGEEAEWRIHIEDGRARIDKER